VIVGSFRSQAREVLVQTILASSFLPIGAPDEIEVDGERWNGTLHSAPLKTTLRAFWGDFDQLSVTGDKKAAFRNDEFESEKTFGELTGIDFQLAVFRTAQLPIDYHTTSFGDGLASHGWACAFKGAGHDRLVSRRWLEYGPWHLIRDEDSDLSFVQFHDLDADPETALKQAKPGHQRMGISKTGGFIQSIYDPFFELKGFYLEDEGILEVVVAGREVTQHEMLEACQARYHQPLDGKHIDNVRYVFVEGEQVARTHLHELWLRELECWAIVDWQKVRLDADYDPGPPQKPEWVLAVEAREAQG